ncbi:protein root UVB sensitive 3-like isoform X2 [Lotus japonicus]|uniref:protein root UVB sensitive 3-like isoform X2 n=1 Tax=Lotus japonicus TaxID=34305 RepID=UPI00258311F5|nr:protein root UVB sensitive 3-like isoform X2 [Lotus japonicus]
MYIRTMLSTQALLSAIGVGEKSATVIGATFQGSNLDSNAKMWRLVADLMNDLVRDLIISIRKPCFVLTNYRAVRCLALTSLNPERSSVLLHHFMETGQGIVCFYS